MYRQSSKNTGEKEYGFVSNAQENKKGVTMKKTKKHLAINGYADKAQQRLFEEDLSKEEDEKQE